MKFELERTKPLKVPSPSPPRPCKRGQPGIVPFSSPDDYCKFPVCPLPRPLFTKQLFSGVPWNHWFIFSFTACLMTAWQLPDNCLTTARQLSDKFLPIVCQLPDNCLTAAWQLPDKCQMVAWQQSDDCLRPAWQLLNNCWIIGPSIPQSQFKKLVSMWDTL